MSEYNVPDVEPGDNGLSVWPVMLGTATVGRVEETMNGYVPVGVDIMGLETWRGQELPFRQAAIDEIKKRCQS